ncbi:MAG: hypothetical protein N0E48_18415 [Candidatus Thiodiazotropha endolucinida]|nr:hypothetical protein [Candidatus Thiodiazotropha taylori]MCW4345309.1 hypothetical protein [Candidatus Thiodiazotropha endolucinida]
MSTNFTTSARMWFAGGRRRDRALYNQFLFLSILLVDPVGRSISTVVVCCNTRHRISDIGSEWRLLKPRTTVIPAQAGIQNA